MIKKIGLVLFLLLLAFIAYLPMEIRECDRLVAEYEPKYFCVPIGFVALPLISALMFVLVIVSVFRKIRR